MLIHPVFVHFPIAFALLELILVAFWLLKKDVHYRDFAFFVNRLTLLFFVAAIITGLMDAGGIGPAWKIMRVRRHLLAVLAAFVLYSFRFYFWKSSGRDNAKSHLIQLIVLNAIIMVAGHWGGELVFED